MKLVEHFKDPLIISFLILSILVGVFCYNTGYNNAGQKYYNKGYLAGGKYGVSQTHEYYEDKLCQIETTPLYYKVKLKNIEDIDTLEILMFSKDLLEKHFGEDYESKIPKDWDKSIKD